MWRMQFGWWFAGGLWCNSDLFILQCNVRRQSHNSEINIWPCHCKWKRVGMERSLSFRTTRLIHCSKFWFPCRQIGFGEHGKKMKMSVWTPSWIARACSRTRECDNGMNGIWSDKIVRRRMQPDLIRWNGSGWVSEHNEEFSGEIELERRGALSDGKRVWWVEDQ